MKLNYRNKKKIVAVIIAIIAAIWSAMNDKGDSSLELPANNIVYTKHAKCRMGCRYLDKSEVNDILTNGLVNKRKSNFNAKPCPVIAKEKKTKDKQTARVVYANCPQKTKIITVIDLDTDHSCHCD